MVREMIPETLEDLVVPIDSLRPFPENPRNGDTDAIKESLEVNGQYRPIVVWKETNEILAGNHTYAAAMELGWKEIAATFVSLKDTPGDRPARDKAKAIVLADNRLNDRASYDRGLLAQLLQELPTYEGTGYTDEYVQALLGELSGSLPLQAQEQVGEQDFWPTIKIKVSHETKARWDKVWNRFTGDDEHHLAGILDEAGY